MKYISMKEYKQTDDYRHLIEHIDAHLEDKRKLTHIDGFYGYKFVQPSEVEYIMDAYDIPFFDKFTTMYYHRQGNLILNLGIFYHQLEYFMKALFIRVYWFNGRENADKFAKFIWNEYCEYNDPHFNELKEQALKIYDECETISQFYKKFVTNDEYTFMKYDEYLDMVTKTFTSIGYHFIMPTLVEFPENSIRIFEDRQATKVERALKENDIDIRQVRLINVFNKLSVDSKYNFIPSSKSKALKSFNFSLIINEGLFFPQLLVFPK